jgi:hypothetical protein
LGTEVRGYGQNTATEKPRAIALYFPFVLEACLVRPAAIGQLLAADQNQQAKSHLLAFRIASFKLFNTDGYDIFTETCTLPSRVNSNEFVFIDMLTAQPGR